MFMIIKLFWAILLLIFGLLAFNNYFLVFPNLIFFQDRTLMLFVGLAVVLASLVILLQAVLLKFHRSF